MLRRMLKADVDADFQVTRGGLRWQLNPSDFVQADLFWYGHKDYWETYHLRKLLQRGSVLFDIGANIGYYAITLAATLGNESRVHAFEPFPPSYERLLTNIALNNLTETVGAHRMALSDRERVAYMRIRVGNNSGSARLDADGESIPTSTLDIFCSMHHIHRLDFVKIDAEGHEEFVLTGGAQTIRRYRPLILLELDPPLLNDSGSSVERVVSLLRSHGYSLHTARRNVLVPMETLPAGRVVVNAFGVPR
jgi:FkbM family methyltransferase